MSAKLAKKLPKRTGKPQKVRMMEQSKKRCAERKEKNRTAQEKREAHNNRMISNSRQTFATATARRNWLDRWV